jgi:hypothetical protein
MITAVPSVPVTLEVIGGCEKLHNKELGNFHSSPNILWWLNKKRMR